ncbi:hypothetical protein FRC02_010176 [Tulasnella sp. 418]|nr:hypothetical protein FRC02_010176 [Tulasnella sp. 418]
MSLPVRKPFSARAHKPKQARSSRNLLESQQESLSEQSDGSPLVSVEQPVMNTQDASNRADRHPPSRKASSLLASEESHREQLTRSTRSGSSRTGVLRPPPLRSMSYNVSEASEGSQEDLLPNRLTDDGWGGSHIVASPDTLSPFTLSPASSVRPSRPVARRQYTDASMQDSESEPPPTSRIQSPPLEPQTPSQSHWHALRDAMASSSALSSISSAIHHPPSTKPSIFPRFGFKHVVEQVTREVTLDSSMRFDEEVRQACWIAKFGTGAIIDGEREQQTGMNTPAASTFTLPLTASSAISVQDSTKYAARKPSTASANPQASLQTLQQVLLRHAPLTTSATGPSGNRLPRESEILAVLVSPFLNRESSKRAEEERWLSVDIFELITKTWRSSSPEAELERWQWCCHVAESGHSQLRQRALLILSATLFQQEARWATKNPASLQTLIQAIVLLPRSRLNQSDEADNQLIWNITSRIFRGDCGPLTAKELTDAYGVICSVRDEERELDIRNGVLIDGILRTMQVGNEANRHWALHNIIETHWPINPIAADGALSPLELQIHTRKINTFTQCSLAVLRPPNHAASDPLITRQNSSAILRIVQSRVLPELREISASAKIPEVLESQRMMVRLLLVLLSSYDHRDRELSAQILEGWWKSVDGWKDILAKEIQTVVSQDEWDYCIEMLSGFMRTLDDGVQHAFMTSCIPLLFERLETDPPTANSALTTLLKALAKGFPRLFYKPLFACAASSKDTTVAPHLRTVMTTAQHMPDYWTSDPEMMAVALMSNPGARLAEQGKTKEGNSTSPWAKPRLGQSMILVELIGHIRRLSEKKKDPAAQPDSSQASEVRFMTSLDLKLSVLMDAQEQSLLMPFSQRLLLTCLLYEMRMFTRSLKSAPWLQRVIMWASHAYEGAIIQPPNSSDSQIQVTNEILNEIGLAMTRVNFVYVECSDRRQSLNLRNFRRSGIRLSTNLTSMDSPRPTTEFFPGTDKQLLLASLPSRLATATLMLLVAVCGLISPEEHKILSPVLWRHYLGDNDKSLVAPTCFLLMQCSEKAPNDLVNMVQNDLLSPEPVTRLSAIERVGTLFSWRLQIIIQQFIPDRSRRRPFRLARQPISFVATDVGSSHYVPPEPVEETKIKIGANLPPELRRRVLELGWGEEERDDTHEKQQFSLVPLSLIPYQELEGMNSIQGKQSVAGKDEEPSARDNKGLVRRKSSSSGYITGLKRKAIMPPPLLPLLGTISKAICDANLEVSESARDLVLMLIRDDPAMLARPIMEGLSKEVTEGDPSFSGLRNLIRAQSPLTPALAHHIFNHLAGLLKTAVRKSDTPTDIAFSQAVPIMALIIAHVSNISVRELRRNKLDPLVFPSFSSTATSAELLPNMSVNSQLTNIFMTRTAQNLLLLRLLEHNPKEINGIRKNFSQVPLLHVGLVPRGRALEIMDYTPNRRTSHAMRNKTIPRMSGIMARSYLLLIAQIFRSLGRHMNDRPEMAKFMDGANRILVDHGDDPDIVSHALIAFMVASTRFRRLFVSKSGFTLFMPSLLKVYCEAEYQPSVRDAIEYAVSRFYALHKETFVFQTLEVASHLLAQLQRSRNEDAAWFSGHVFTLVATLSKVSVAKDVDAAGIHGVNQEQERDALIILVNEKPELLLPSLARSNSRTNPVIDIDQVSSLGDDGFDTERFSLDDFVRLFLTVIPHNPQVIRSQLFLTLFRCLVPSLYNASTTARNVLRDGIQAFASAVFERLQTRNRAVLEGNAARSGDEQPLDDNRTDGTTDSLFGVKPMAPNDRTLMRKEYLLLVAAFASVGGQLERSALTKFLHLLREALRDNIQTVAEPAAEVVNQFSQRLLAKEGGTPARSAVIILKEMVPLFRLYASSVDFTETVQAISQLALDPVYSSDKEFVKVVATDFCAPALQTCHIAGTARVLFNLPMRLAVVTLLANTIALPGVDVLSGLERHAPTSMFLAGIVLPLCLQLKTSLEVAAENQWQDIWKQEAHRRAWIRLLAYAMTVAEDSVDGEDSNEKGDEEKWERHRTASSGSEEKAVTLVVALQIIKVIAIRAEKDISFAAPGIWGKIATFMGILSDGNAVFALQPTSLHLPSPTEKVKVSYAGNRSISSPIQEPKRSLSAEEHRNSMNSGMSIGSAIRLVDYLLWSLLELVCRHRFPLTAHLRYWVQEKMHNLDAQVRSSSIGSIGGPQSAIGRRESRRVSTAFSKPRLRGQGKHSGGPSPEASPLVRSVSPLQSRPPSFLNLDNHGPEFQYASYNRFPNASPGQRSDSAPRIIHLGPSSRFTSEPLLAPPPQFQLAPNDTADALRLSLKRTNVAGASLVRATHRRVRIVQSSMGYDPIPLPGEMENNDWCTEIDGRAWSKSEALHSVLQELRELLVEFDITGSN